MSSTTDLLIKNLAETIVENQNKKPSAYDTQAEVRRVEGDIAWVHIPGGVDETPVQLTTNAKKGDIVQVRVSGGRAWLYGNQTAPPTDDTKAIRAESKALVADEHATNALTSAMLAQQFSDEAKDAAADATTAANTAETKALEASANADIAYGKAQEAIGYAEDASLSALSAYNSASSAISQLSVVEDIVGVLSLVAENGTYERTQDNTPLPDKWYFTQSGYPGGTYNGSIVSFETLAGNNISSLNAAFDPIQDLNGYDAPWIGGAGKNKIPQPYSDVYTIAVQGVTFTKNSDGSVKAVGTVTTAGDYTLYDSTVEGSGINDGFSGSFILSGSVGGSSSTYRIACRIRDTSAGTNRYLAAPDGDSATITTSANEVINRIYLTFNNGVNVNTTFYPMLRLSSVSDSTYEPYENICPISGRSSVDTVRTGANLVRVARAYSSKNGITYTENADGTVHANGTASAESLSAGNPVSAITDADSRCLYTLPIGTYNIRNISGGRIYCQIIKADLSASISTRTLAVGNETNVTLTEPSVIYIRVDLASGTAIDADINVTVVKGTTALTPYVPWNGSTYTTALGRTVYGGTLDVVSGELTVTHKLVDLSSLSWTYSYTYSDTGRAVYYAPLTDYKAYTNAQVAGCIAERYETASVNNVLTTTGRIGTGAYSRVWCSTTAQGTTPTGNFVYELNTPTTYQLTPQQIQTLLGVNNIWAGSGDISVIVKNTYSYAVATNPVFEYVLTSDTAIVQDKPYYTRSGSGTEQDPYIYTQVQTPVQANIGTYYEYTNWNYYELTGVDQAIQNYVSSHLAFANGVLYLQNGETRVSLSTDANIGLVFENNGQQVAQYGKDAIIGDPRGFHITTTANYNNTNKPRISFYRDGNNEVAYISEDKLYITRSVVLQQMDVGDANGQWSWKIHVIDGRNNLYLKWLG